MENKICECCGFEVDELYDRPKPKIYISRKDEGILSWAICSQCESKTHPHEFYPHSIWKDICVYCGQKFNHEIHH